MQVSTASLAANIGLKPNDFLNSIAGQEVFNMTHDEVKYYFIICFYVYFYVILPSIIFVQADKCIMQAGNRFNMVIERWVEMGPISGSSTDYSPKLSEENFHKSFWLNHNANSAFNLNSKN